MCARVKKAHHSGYTEKIKFLRCMPFYSHTTDIWCRTLYRPHAQRQEDSIAIFINTSTHIYRLQHVHPNADYQTALVEKRWYMSWKIASTCWSESIWSGSGGTHFSTFKEVILILCLPLVFVRQFWTLFTHPFPSINCFYLIHVKSNEAFELK